MLKQILFQGTHTLSTRGNRRIAKEIILALFHKGAAKVFASVQVRDAMEEITELLERYESKVEEISLDIPTQADMNTPAAQIDMLDILISNPEVIPLGNLSNGSALKTIDSQWKVNIHLLLDRIRTKLKNYCPLSSTTKISVSSIAWPCKMT